MSSFDSGRISLKLGIAHLMCALVLASTVALAGDVTETDSNLNRGDPGCGPGECMTAEGTCERSTSRCCDEGHGAGPSAPGVSDQLGCASTAAGNPIDMRNGNKFHRETLFVGEGEMPLRFELFYNSKHLTTRLPTVKIRGQWTYTYSAHVIIDLQTTGLGDSVVEVRKDDGQAIVFREPSAGVLANLQPGDVAEFIQADFGDFGFFRGFGYDPIANTFSHFEYEDVDRSISTFSYPAPPVDVAPLVEVRNAENVRHTVQRTLDALNDEWLVTVTRSGGDSFSFTYDDLVEGLNESSPQNPEQNSDSPCFRCPTVIFAPNADFLPPSVDEPEAFTVQQNAQTRVIERIVYPNDPTDPPPTPKTHYEKTFLYEKTPSNVTNCASGIWTCETALTGIVDEEDRRWATWDYWGILPQFVPPVNIGLYAWAYVSYHGSTAELEDHVEFSQFDFEDGSVNSFDDKFVATYRHGLQDVFNIDHEDEDNFGSHRFFPPRLGARRDLRFWPDTATKAYTLNSPNLEDIVGVGYAYYDDTNDPGGDRLGLIRQLVVRNQVQGTTPTHRKKITFDYDSNRLMTLKQEFEGPESGPPTLLRTTGYVWNATHRKPSQIVVSRDGTAATMEYQEDRLYTPEGRLEVLTITDLTTHTEPYVTLGRTRVYGYDYTYHDPGKTTLQRVEIDGPRGISAGALDITTYEFIASGHLERITDGEGNETVWAGFNGRGQPGSRTGPDGVVTTYSYNARGWLRSRTVGSSGATWEYSYYGNGLLRRIDFPDGDFLEFDYTDARKLSSISNGFGDSVEYVRTHETSGGVRTGVLRIDALVKDAGVLVAQSSVRLDARGRLYESIGGDPANPQRTIFRYALVDRLTSIVKSDPRVGDPSYPDAADLTTAFSYDGLDRVKTITYPLSMAGAPQEVAAFEYNLRNQITRVTDARGVQSDYIRDGFGELIRLASPDSGTTDFWYDEAGNLERDDREVASGTTSRRRRAYDNANRLLTETAMRVPTGGADVAGVVRNWEYDNAIDPTFLGVGGRLHRYTDESGETRFGYDEYGYPDLIETRVQSSLGTQTFLLDYDFDAEGNLSELTYPSGRRVSNVRTSGRIASVGWTAPNSGPYSELASSVDYFPFGQIDGLTFGNGWQRSRERDVSGRVESEHVFHLDPATGPTLYRRTYEYDPFNQIEVIRHFHPTDALNATAAVDEVFGYDQRHRLTSAVFSSGLPGASYPTPYGMYGYTYDEGDNRDGRTFTPPGGMQTAEAVEYQVSPVLSNRAMSVSDPGNPDAVPRRLEYDLRGNRVVDEKSDADKVKFAFDDRNQVDQVLRKVVPEPGFAVMLGIGVAGIAMLRRGRVEKPAGGVASRRRPRGSARWLQWIVCSCIGAVLFAPVMASAQQDTDTDGIPDSFEIATQSLSGVIPLNENVDVDAGLDFDLDGATNLEEYQANSGSVAAFVAALYDPLVCAPDCHPIINSFEVDEHELIDSGLVTLTWTATHTDSVFIEPIGVAVSGGSGSLANVVVNESTFFTLRAINFNGSRVDHEKVEVFTVAVDNDYNAANQRVRRDISGSDERLFVYGAGGELLGEYGPDGTTLVEYVSLEGEPIAQIRGGAGAGQTHFVHTTHIGAPERLTASDRSVKWAVQVTPFGEVIDETNTLAQGETQDTRFPGQYADAGLDVSYNWHRYYDPSLGRYISADPIGQAGGVNVYNYAANDPVNYVDPRGLFRFGRRPLKGLPWVPGASHNRLDNALNTELSHEQGFFEDGTGENIGFGQEGRFSEDTDGLGYRYDDEYYSDSLMRRALENVPDGEYSLLGLWPGLDKNNCQDWADRARDEYNRLLNEPGGQSSPGLTPSPPNMSYGR